MDDEKEGAVALLIIAGVGVILFCGGCYFVFTVMHWTLHK